MVFGDWFGASIMVLDANDVLEKVGFHGVWAFTLHATATPTLYLVAAGVAVAWYCYILRPDTPGRIQQTLALPYRVLDRKYGFDELYINGFAAAGRGLGNTLWRIGDVQLIDGLLVNGTARSLGRIGAVLRHGQTGYLFHYAFVMIIGLLVLLTWFIFALR